MHQAFIFFFFMETLACIQKNAGSMYREICCEQVSRNMLEAKKRSEFAQPRNCPKSVHPNIMNKFEQFLDDFSVWGPRIF